MHAHADSKSLRALYLLGHNPWRRLLMAHEYGCCHLYEIVEFKLHASSVNVSKKINRKKGGQSRLFLEKMSYFDVFRISSPTDFPQTHSKGSILFSRLFQDVTCAHFRHLMSSNPEKTTPFVKSTALGTDIRSYLSLDFDLNLAIEEPQDYNRATFQQHLGDGIVAQLLRFHLELCVRRIGLRLRTNAATTQRPNLENVGITWVTTFSENNLKRHLDISSQI